MPNVFVPEEDWAPAAGGVNHPLHVRAQREHGLVEADYGYWGFSPSSNPAGGYREYGVDALGMNPDGYFSDQENDQLRPRLRRLPRGDQPDPTYGDGVVTPHASFLAMMHEPDDAFANLVAHRERSSSAYGAGGFFDAVAMRSGTSPDATSRSTRPWSWARSATSWRTTCCVAPSAPPTSSPPCGRSSASRSSAPGSSPSEPPDRVSGACCRQGPAARTTDAPAVRHDTTTRGEQRMKPSCRPARRACATATSTATAGWTPTRTPGSTSASASRTSSGGSQPRGEGRADVPDRHRGRRRRLGARASRARSASPRRASWCSTSTSRTSTSTPSRTPAWPRGGTTPLQALAERTPHGIPVTISTDPRHAFIENAGVSFTAGRSPSGPSRSAWPRCATPTPSGEFADIARQEYVAVGIRAALHPTLDLATEPRWARQAGTFGQDPDLVTELGHGLPRRVPGGVPRADAASPAPPSTSPAAGPQKDGEDAALPLRAGAGLPRRSVRRPPRSRSPP